MPETTPVRASCRARSTTRAARALAAAFVLAANPPATRAHSGAHDRPADLAAPAARTTGQAPRRLGLSGLTLRGAGGRVVDVAGLAAGPLLVYFGFTRCTDVCPLGVARLAEAARRLDREHGLPVRPVFVSLDARRDDPEQTARYAARFDGGVLGLWEDKWRVFRVARAFGIRYYAAGSGDGYEVTHEDRIHLVGPGGRLLASFGPEVAPGDLARHAAALLAGVAPATARATALQADDVRMQP